MLKKSTIAVMTALTTMLSALSPFTAYAENPEPVETIPDRNISDTTFIPYATAPVVYDSEYVQTTAATIPDRNVCCTTVSSPANAPDIFPLDNNVEFTVKLMDWESDEHVKGALIHLVETESPESNVIKRDFGTWNTSDSDSYVINFDYTLKNSTDMALITAVIEYMPEEYTLWANTECPVIDSVVDASYMRFEQRSPNTEMTIGLRKKQSSTTTTNPENPDNPDTTENPANVTCWLCKKEIAREDAVNTPIGVWLCQECSDKHIIGTTTSAYYHTTTTSTTTVTTQTTLPPWLGTQTTTDNEETHPCDICKKVIKVSDGVTTPLGLFICKECKSMGLGGTTTSTTTATTQTTVPTTGTRPPWMTNTTATFIPEDIGIFTAYCRVFDSNTNEIVENLELELIEEKSEKVIASWTSTDEPYIKDIIYPLEGDKNYILRIVNMPDEYKIDETVPESSINLEIPEGTEINGTIAFSIFIRDENTNSTNGGKLIYGDANCDEKVTIADAVLIMQSISNPDSYKISERGIMNADVYNRGDGITSADALTIQEVEAHTITLNDLPLSE